MCKRVSGCERGYKGVRESAWVQGCVGATLAAGMGGRVREFPPPAIFPPESRENINPIGCSG